MRIPLKISAIVLGFYLATCFLLTAFGFSDQYPVVMSVISVIFTGLLVFSLTSGVTSDRNDFLILIGSFFVKLFYLLYRLLFKFGANLTNPTLTTDAKRFWGHAVELYQGGAVQSDTRFPYVLNGEFHIFGKNILCVFLLNILMTVMMALLVVAVLNKFKVKGKSRTLALLVASFLPYEIIASSSLLRESLYFVFIALSFYFYILYIERGAYKYMLLAILAMVPVSLLHIGYFFIVIVYFMDSFKNDRPKSGKQLFLRIFLLVFLVALVVIAIRMDSGSSGYISRGIEGFMSKISGESGSSSVEKAGSTYLSGMKITSIPTLVLYAPIRAFFFLFSPLPMNWRGMTDILAFLADSCIHLLVIVCTIHARWILKKKTGLATEGTRKMCRLLGVGLLIIVMIAFVFCLNTGNSGTAIRHRDVLIGIEAILLGLSLKIRSGDFAKPASAVRS